MEANKYQRLASRTLIDAPTEPITLAEIQMLATMLRLHRAVGKLTEKIKKRVLHRHSPYHWHEYLEDSRHLSQLLGVILDDASAQKLYQVPNDDSIMILWIMIGLLGESSELADLALKFDLDFTDLDWDFNLKDEFKGEIGDVAWYLAAIATKTGLDLDDAFAANIEKLKQRYPDGFSSEASAERVDLGEPVGQPVTGWEPQKPPSQLPHWFVKQMSDDGTGRWD